MIKDISNLILKYNPPLVGIGFGSWLFWLSTGKPETVNFVQIVTWFFTMIGVIVCWLLIIKSIKSRCKH